ncbi:hypothetical protein BDN72DRAFT_903437 [Pluteus cervinus]|uniref:Uncharacterized protein n=1 Tax=Pluteus cervinus TaxID=181527 RepID=A0ACD3A933_9AGAR|nr:hypothetical protein BDN72DRAFT_903437 [Pluteus cervinus]
MASRNLDQLLHPSDTVLVSWNALVYASGTHAASFCVTQKKRIPSCFLSQTELGQSICVGTLLDVIHSTKGPETHWLNQLFNRKSDDGDVWVSTIRSPEFGSRLRSPQTGYRCLGTYSELRDKKGIPCGALHEEVLGLCPSQPNIENFIRTFNVWGPASGLRAEYHFIIIFETPKLPIPPASSLQTPQSPSLPPTHNDLVLPSNTSSPQLPPALPQGPIPASPQELSSLEATPVILSSTHSREPSPLLPDHCVGSAIQNEDEFTPQLSIPEACALGGLSDKTLQAAMFLPATRVTPLFQVLMNFKHLLMVLETFELTEPRSTRVFSGGLQLSMEDILQHLNWNIFSYYKKYAAFQWAVKVSQAHWKGLPPSKGDPLHILYERWRGIVWYFRLGGGLDSQVPPQAVGIRSRHRGQDADEVAAAKLRQVMLLEGRGALEGFLSFS